jgi:peptidoglycan-N-acetylglucosamine deacetylase
MYRLLSYLFPSLIWKIKTNEKILYLTFDDGPIPELTPWVLSELNKYQAKATFFCIGDNVKKHQQIYQQIIDNGHHTGNHTQHHLNAWKVKTDEYIKDVKDASYLITSKLFRPPYGKIKPAIIRKLKKDFKIVMWNVLSYDFDNSKSSDWCTAHVIKESANGSVIVFHDSIKSKERMQASLPKVLHHFSQLGYSFKAIPF